MNLLFGGGIKYKSDEINEKADKIQSQVGQMFLKKLQKKKLKVKSPKTPEVDHYAGCKGYA